MTSLLIYIKHRFPWIWSIAEQLNGRIFTLLYPSLSGCAEEVLSGYSREGFIFSVVSRDDIASLGEFRRNQTTRYLSWFDPHPFDRHTLERLYDNDSYAMMKITDSGSGRIAGYFFLRCFFIGKAFHGLIVDERYNNRGLGTAMWALSAQICDRAGLRMFATVSEHNKASLISAKKATEVRVADKLANDYLLIECKYRKQG